MRRSAVALAALLLLPLPAVAQAADPATLDTVAAVLGGIAEGAKVDFGPARQTPFTRTAPGVFENNSAAGTGKLTVVESSPCVFDVTVDINGETQGVLRFSANKLAGIVYTPADDNGDLHNFGIALTGPDGVMSTVDASGTVTPTTSSSTFSTTLTLDDLNAAVAKLQEACPAVAM